MFLLLKKKISLLTLTMYILALRKHEGKDSRQRWGFSSRHLPSEGWLTLSQPFPAAALLCRSEDLDIWWGIGLTGQRDLHVTPKAMLRNYGEHNLTQDPVQTWRMADKGKGEGGKRGSQKSVYDSAASPLRTWRRIPAVIWNWDIASKEEEFQTV